MSRCKSSSFVHACNAYDIALLCCRLLQSGQHTLIFFRWLQANGDVAVAHPDGLGPKLPVPAVTSVVQRCITTGRADVFFLLRFWLLLAAGCGKTSLTCQPEHLCNLCLPGCLLLHLWCQDRGASSRDQGGQDCKGADAVGAHASIPSSCSSCWHAHQIPLQLSVLASPKVGMQLCLDLSVLDC